MKDKEVKMKDKGVNLLADEVEAIKEAISFVFETGYSDKTATLIESVAALTTIDTVMNLAIKRERKESEG